MAYSSGGVISATDFNTLTNNTNTIMGVGTGQSGYGQTVTALANLTTSTTVTAAQWSGFLTILNNALMHQSGAGAAIAGTNFTAGSVITYFAAVNTATTTISTNKALYTANGATVVGSGLATTITVATSWTRTVTFASGNAARYFFNAGGHINWVISATNSNGTLHSGDIATGWTSIANGSTYTNATGSTNSIGYWQLTTNNQTVSSWSATSYYAYNSDSGSVAVKASAANASGNGDNGAVITYTFTQAIAAALPATQAVSVAFSVHFDIVKPESTYLTDSWGMPTIA